MLNQNLSVHGLPPVGLLDGDNYASDSDAIGSEAEAEAEALSEVLEINLKELATKQDIRLEVRDLEHRLDARFERIDGELKLTRWMLGVMLAGVMSLVLKAFF